MTHYRTLTMGCRASLLAITWAACGWSAPALRNQVDLRGDFVLFGNTLGWDCITTGTPPPAPVVGTVNCTGVTNGNDSGVDVYWQSSLSGGSAVANSTIVANDTASAATAAASTAVLVVPTPYTIKYARLYWSAHMPAPAGGRTAAQDAPFLAFQ